MANPFSLESIYFFNTDQLGSGREERLRAALKDVACVTDIRCERSKLYIDINTSRPNSNDAQKLVAIYREFGGDLRQLTTLLWKGMTVNERLSAAGLMNAYDASKAEGNLDRINEILGQVGLRQDENGMNRSISDGAEA